MSQPNNDHSILNRVYLLLALTVFMACLAILALMHHSRDQENLYQRISNYHAPTIYYSDKLIESLESISKSGPLSIRSENKSSMIQTLNNPLYSIKNHFNAIKTLSSQFQNSEPDKALLRLQQSIFSLSNALTKLSILERPAYSELLPLIDAALLRAQQLNRLHVRSTDELRHEIISQAHTNEAVMIVIFAVAIVIAGTLFAPLVLSIKKLLEKLFRSEKKQREAKELAIKEQSRMAALLSAMSIGILFEDKQGLVEYINPAFKRMWALDESKSLIGLPLSQLLDESPQQFTSPENSSKYVLQVLDTHEISERFEIDFNDGRILTQLSYPVLDSDKGILGRLWVYEDITHERQTAQQLLYLAEHDHLTGLFNRHRFQQHLTFMIDSCRRNDIRFALLYFDLDEFKYINDTYGHGTGDSVLLRTASEVSTLVRGTEMFARLGGDEFAILTILSDDKDLKALPERIVSAVSSIPFRFRGTNLRLTVSIGVAVYPEHGINGEDLVAHADAAMYQAKRQGKNTWALYNPEQNKSELMVERMSWSRRIGLALEQDLLELHFQGIYKAESLHLSHLEVLVRMRDPSDHSRLIMPGAFIPFSEKTAQIVEIDRCVLLKSIKLLAQYPELPALAVNISGRSFDEPSLPGFIRENLLKYAVNPERLIIELTETETVSDLQDAQRFIEAIHHAGCRICLDDFGSGFSTFTYLKYLNVEILKIDGLFVRDLVNNHENQVFVKAMVSIAQGLGKSVVAEFVENAETLEMLKSFGVQFVQGYFLDKPTDQHKVFSDIANKV